MKEWNRNRKYHLKTGSSLNWARSIKEISFFLTDCDLWIVRAVFCQKKVESNNNHQMFIISDRFQFHFILFDSKLLFTNRIIINDRNNSNNNRIPTKVLIASKNRFVCEIVLIAAIVFTVFIYRLNVKPLKVATTSWTIW